MDGARQNVEGLCLATAAHEGYEGGYIATKPDPSPPPKTPCVTHSANKDHVKLRLSDRGLLRGPRGVKAWW